MNDIVERLRSSVMWYSANAETVMEAAAEIERLRARLEIDPSHPYDGIYARDETIRQQDKQIARLRAGGCARDQGTTQYCAEAAKLAAENERLREWNAEIALNAREFAAENERLRAALERLACTCDRVGNAECSSGEVDCPFWQARAALEGRT